MKSIANTVSLLTAMTGATVAASGSGESPGKALVLWTEGHVHGLRARGGFEVDISWKRGRLTRVQVRSLSGNRCRIRYRKLKAAPRLRAGELVILNEKLALR